MSSSELMNIYYNNRVYVSRVAASQILYGHTRQKGPFVRGKKWDHSVLRANDTRERDLYLSVDGGKATAGVIRSDDGVVSSCRSYALKSSYFYSSGQFSNR